MNVIEYAKKNKMSRQRVYYKISKGALIVQMSADGHVDVIGENKAWKPARRGRKFKGFAQEAVG